jgi:hypothetical protein
VSVPEKLLVSKKKEVLHTKSLVFHTERLFGFEKPFLFLVLWRRKSELFQKKENHLAADGKEIYGFLY